jgi:hypothetical protein
MAVGLRGPKLELRCTICDKVSSYAIYTTRELVLHTYGEGNKRGRVGDGATVQTTLGGGDWLL